MPVLWFNPYVFKSTPVSSNVIAWYDFTNTTCYNPLVSTTAVTDLSPSGYNLTFNSAPTLDKTGPGGITMGVIIPGSGYADRSGITYNIGSGYTVETLYKLTTLPGGYPSVLGLTSGSRGNAQNGFTMNVTATGFGGAPSVPYFASGTTSFGNTFLRTTPPLSTNTYYHTVASVSSGGTVTTYINGSTTTAGTTTLPSGNQTGYIGTGFVMPGGATIQGTTAILKLYNVARTPAQVSSDYNTIKSLSGNPYGLP